MSSRILGADIRVGDTIVVWWAPKRDTITALEPYVGNYAETICKGARIARFALLPCGMTFFPDEEETLIARGGEVLP